ncbi:MAG: class I SAM-dependent methyltransferase [Coxiellaceae bacterium]|nr:class I SAM-dependent methyltransferase [Coxiellaceae bacterium]
MKSEELGLPIEYQQHPEFFDIPSNMDNANEKNKVIEKLLKKHNVKTVLDMTCGTGAQVFYLAKRGYQVIGSDFSPALLEIARNKALDQKTSIQFVDGDIRELQLGQFDAAITIDNAIGHLVKDDFDIAIKNIYKNLRQGGIYIFDILNLDAMTDEVIVADSKKMTNQTVTADGTTIDSVRRTTIDRENGYLTSDEIFTIQKDGKEKKLHNRCTLQIYTMNEIKNMLAKNGFKVIEQDKIDAYTFHQDDAGYSILTVAEKK